ncbi:MAG: membrane protein insertase YidC [Actinobacteria bacterium]|nr:membrane protein insertase YidC [Actinomycetota bacterium]
MFILDWLRYGVSWILVQFHKVFGSWFGQDSGWAWVLSIIGLVVVIRILLIPLFVKQIHAQRNMQLVQPRMKEIQKKYQGDRQKQSEEMMKLYRETGTNPLASCLPILLQMPIFFALFSVLQGVAKLQPEGVFNDEPALLLSAHNATIFNVPLYGTFMDASETAYPINTRILSLILIVCMVATTFMTQRQLMLKNTASDNPMVKQQKIMMYVFPLIFAVAGINFPVGVLIYWFTTNLWSMGQQFYVIRNNPQPGTPAAEAHARRKAEKEARKAVRKGEAESVEEVLKPETKAAPARQQPKRQSRNKRKAGPGSQKSSSNNTGGSSGDTGSNST